ncbi:MAG: hypothetical protein PVH54_13375 [Gammaproteobacteria bacterium]
MELKKQGVILDCEQCKCASCKGGSFEVTVPVCDTETGIHAAARLHCTVCPAYHEVELVEWHAAGSTGPPGKVLPRIAAALGFVADHRICGNRHICPQEVIRIVEAHGGSSTATDDR